MKLGNKVCLVKGLDKSKREDVKRCRYSELSIEKQAFNSNVFFLFGVVPFERNIERWAAATLSMSSLKLDSMRGSWLGAF